MKLRLVCLLLAGAFFSLAAQTNRSVSVFMPLVTGTGIDEQDSAFFYMMIYHELEARGISMGRASFSTDYSLIGTLSPVGTAGASPREYALDLFLEDNRTGQFISEQRYRYTRLEYAEVAVNTMLDTILSLIQPARPPSSDSPPQTQTNQQPVRPNPLPTQPAQQGQGAVQQGQGVVQQGQATGQQQGVAQQGQAAGQQGQAAAQQGQDVGQQGQADTQQGQGVVQQGQAAGQQGQGVTQQGQIAGQQGQGGQTDKPGGDWRDSWLFLGLTAAWNPRIYMGEGPAFNLINPNIGFYPELQVLDSVSLETGFGLTPEWITVSEDDDFRDLMLEIPLLLKIVLKPSEHFLLEPYSGVAFNFSLFQLTKPSPVSWVAGYQHGVRAGQGAFFFDFRFSMDLGKSSFVKYPDITYQRYGVSFGIGYKYGLFPKE